MYFKDRHEQVSRVVEAILSKLTMDEVEALIEEFDEGDEFLITLLMQQFSDKYPDRARQVFVFDPPQDSVMGFNFGDKAWEERHETA